MSMLWETLFCVVEVSSSKVNALSENELSKVNDESAAGGWNCLGFSIEVTRAEK